MPTATGGRSLQPPATCEPERPRPAQSGRPPLLGVKCHCADRSKHGHVMQSVGMAHAAWDTRNWLERCWLRPVAPSEWTSAAAQSGLGVGPEPVQLGMALSDEARSVRVCNARQRFLQTSHTKYGTGSRRPGTLRIRTLIGEAGCWLRACDTDEHASALKLEGLVKQTDNHWHRDLRIRALIGEGPRCSLYACYTDDRAFKLKA